jgi:hypothetical protein
MHFKSRIAKGGRKGEGHNKYRLISQTRIAGEKGKKLLHCVALEFGSDNAFPLFTAI